MRQAVIQIKNLSKKYSIRRKDSTEEFIALDNINFEAKQGDKIGFFGPNGAGKTTFLKTIAGITCPTSGKVETQGRVISLLNLSAGFHPELSGKENILLNGLLVGMTKKEVKAKSNDIVSFASLKQFIDAPFYTYSSGMKFRLAMSIAINSQPDILLIDEFFNTGDAAFQKKTITALSKLKSNKKLTIITCSHAPLFIWRLSEKFYYLNKGKISHCSKRKIIKSIDMLDKQWRQMCKFPRLK